jgi:peptide deformylase
MILPVVKYGDPVLERGAEPVSDFGQELEQLAKNMVETMYAAPGYGLAAPQVGVSKRLIVLDDSVGRTAESLLVLVNPEIINSEGEQCEEEGCLSFPDFTAKVKRPMHVIVSAQDVKGQHKIFEAQSLLARILTHEIDHLNGVLFIHHLSSLKRDIIKRKIRRKVRAGEWQ